MLFRSSFMDDVSVVTKKDLFEKSIFRNVENISKSIAECVSQASIKAQDVELIILTGGSTEIPFVKQTLCSFFPNAEISDENKFSSVGLGLAYDSARKFV